MAGTRSGRSSSRGTSQRTRPGIRERTLTAIPGEPREGTEADGSRGSPGVPAGPPEEAARSLALPLDLVFSESGETLFAAAFGSGSVAVLDAEAEDAVFAFSEVKLGIIPAVSVIGFLAIGLIPTLWVFVVFHVIRRAGEFSLAKPARETIYTRVDREVRYKGKAVIVTGGSRGIRTSHEYVRKGGATARTMLVQAAANSWGVPAAECSAANSVITHKPTGRTTTYGKVAEAAAKLPPPGDVTLKDPKEWKLIGKSVKRLDTLPKVTGEQVYGADLKLPGMLNAAIKDCPVFGGKVKSFEAAKVSGMPGVRHVLPVGDSAVAVVADTWWQAKTALDALTLEQDGACRTGSRSSPVPPTGSAPPPRPGRRRRCGRSRPATPPRTGASGRRARRSRSGPPAATPGVPGPWRRRPRRRAWRCPSRSRPATSSGTSPPGSRGR